MSILCPAWFLTCVHRNPFFNKYILPYTFAWRIRRRTSRFLKLLEEKNFGRVSYETVPEAGSISNVLILNSLGGLGDALYVNGLVHYLVTSGLKVSVVSAKNVNSIFRTTLSEKAIYDIFDSAARKRLYSKEWDAVVDLSFYVFPGYNVRAEILSNIQAPVLGIDPRIRTNPFACTEYLDLSDSKHIGERFASIANRITGRNIQCLSPFVGVPARKTSERYIYVNTIGSGFHKTLSQKQIDWLAQYFDSREIKAYFYCPQDVDLSVTEYVKRVRPTSFAEACSWVAAAQAVITPDTSILHVAEAYGVPQLTFFARNIPSGFGATVLEEFHPLTSSVNVVPKKRNFLAKEIVPISAMEKEELETALSVLMKKISDPEASRIVTYINVDAETLESAMGGVNSFNINGFRGIISLGFAPNFSSFSYLHFLKTLAFLSPPQALGNELSFHCGGSL